MFFFFFHLRNNTANQRTVTADLVTAKSNSKSNPKNKFVSFLTQKINVMLSLHTSFAYTKYITWSRF